MTSEPTSWTREWLANRGFEGFVPFADLPDSAVPNVDGVYAIVRPARDEPTFVELSPARHFKGRDPSLQLPELQTRWIPGTSVVYIGKAAAGPRGRRGLRKRLDEYRRHGVGEPVGHWGGRAIWQLSDSSELLVAWLPTPGRDPEEVETELLQEFTAQFGRLPFANRRRGRAKS